MKLNKSPGFDGFTSNYYKKKNPVLLTTLNLLFNEILISDSIPPTWNQGRLILLPKPRHDHLDPKAFCPISILNQDYRLFASVFASRLNHFIAQYIEEEQTGFIPGRDTGYNIRKTINIIQYASKMLLANLVFCH